MVLLGKFGIYNPDLKNGVKIEYFETLIFNINKNTLL